MYSQQHKRDIEIARRVGEAERSVTFAEIGKEYGITQSRVSQILANIGVSAQRKAQRRLLRQYTCTVCGKSYKAGERRKPGEGSKIHCSEHIRSWRSPVTRTCARCKIVFTHLASRPKRRFCSRTCWHKRGKLEK